MKTPGDGGDGGDGGDVVPISKKKKKKKRKRTAEPGSIGYTCTDADGDKISISNFKARLLVTFDWPDGSRTYRVCLKTSSGETEPLEIDGYLMATRTRLNSKIGGFGSPVIPSWFGNDVQLQVLRQHISAQVPHCPRATRVEHYGLTCINGDWIWAFGNIVIRGGEVAGPNQDGIFQFSDGVAVALADWCADHDGGVARAPTLDNELPEVMSQTFMLEAVQQFDSAWGDAGLLALGWAWALQYRAICIKLLRLFPYLYLHGASGGGKTSLAHVLGSLWYGPTETPEVDLPDRGTPTFGTFRGFERTMASEILVLLDEAGPTKMKNCSDMLKRMGTGTSARRARRNDRADTRVIVPRAGVMLTSNGRVDGEEAMMRRCVVLNLPKLRDQDKRRVSEIALQRLIGKGWRMSSYLLHHLGKLTGDEAPEDGWYVSPKMFIDAVRVRMKSLGDICGSDQIALSYAIAEVGLLQLLLVLGAIDSNLESTAHFNRDRRSRFSRFVEGLCQHEVSGRGETNLPGSFFNELDSHLTTGDAHKLQPHCWTRDISFGPDGAVVSGVVWLRVDKIGHVMKGRPGTGPTWMRQWSGLLDELAEVDYLTSKNVRVRPPSAGGVTKAAIRGMWGFAITDSSPSSLASISETLCNTSTNTESNY